MTHRSKFLLLLLPLCAFLLLTGFASSFEKSYQEAEALLAQGDLTPPPPGSGSSEAMRKPAAF